MKTVVTVLSAITLCATTTIARADEAPVPQPMQPAQIQPAQPAPPPPPADPAPPPEPVVVQPAPPAPPSVPDAQATPGVPTPKELESERKTEVQKQAFFRLYGAGSASVTNPSVNGQLGARFRLSDFFMLGLDAEVDGLIGVQTPKLRTGILDIYATGIFHYPLRFEQINLRATVQLGTATMLVDLYGAPRGTTGIYVGGTPLGIEWKVADHLTLVWDALGVALPAPQLKNAPFAYPMYRTTIGVEVGF